MFIHRIWIMMIHNMIRMTGERNVHVFSITGTGLILYTRHDRWYEFMWYIVFVVVGFLFGCGCCVCVCVGLIDHGVWNVGVWSSRVIRYRCIYGNRHIRSTRHQSDYSSVQRTENGWSGIHDVILQIIVYYIYIDTSNIGILNQFFVESSTTTNLIHNTHTQNKQAPSGWSCRINDRVLLLPTATTGLDHHHHAWGLWWGLWWWWSLLWRPSPFPTIWNDTSSSEPPNHPPWINFILFHHILLLYHSIIIKVVSFGVLHNDQHRPSMKIKWYHPYHHDHLYHHHHLLLRHRICYNQVK